MKRQYRIVTDRYAGYEVQYWRWWWPFWRQCDLTNTHQTLDGATKYAEAHARGGSNVVRYLGEYTP